MYYRRHTQLPVRRDLIPSRVPPKLLYSGCCGSNFFSVRCITYETRTLFRAVGSDTDLPLRKKEHHSLASLRRKPFLKSLSILRKTRAPRCREHQAQEKQMRVFEKARISSVSFNIQEPFQKRQNIVKNRFSDFRSEQLPSPQPQLRLTHPLCSYASFRVCFLSPTFRHLGSCIRRPLFRIPRPRSTAADQGAAPVSPIHDGPGRSTGNDP